MHKYFVSYKSHGAYGRLEVTMKNEISSVDDVDAVEEMIIRNSEHGITECVIINIQRLPI